MTQHIPLLGGVICSMKYPAYMRGTAGQCFKKGFTLGRNYRPKKLDELSQRALMYWAERFGVSSAGTRAQIQDRLIRAGYKDDIQRTYPKKDEYNKPYEEGVLRTRYSNEYEGIPRLYR